MVGAPSVIGRLPWWVLGLVSVALLAQGFPGAANVLVYDRAAIGGGDWWRIITGHLVHFSTAHLINNLAVLVPAVWLVETRYCRDAGPLFLLAGLAIGLTLLVAEPRILQFGGASGICFAFLVYACLRGLKEGRVWRMVCAIVLAIVGAKILAELAGWHVTDWQQADGFVPVMLSHAVGAAVGSFVYLRHVLGRGGRSRIR